MSTPDEKQYKVNTTDEHFYWNKKTEKLVIIIVELWKCKCIV